MSGKGQNYELLKSIKRDISELRSLVNNISQDITMCKNEIRDLNARMPVRKQGWTGGYWHIKDGTSILHDNLNN